MSAKSERELAAILAAIDVSRAKAAERRKRYHERHPNARKEYQAKHQRATTTLLDRHRAEYQELCAIIRADETDRLGRKPVGDVVFRKARKALRERHADEWSDILAAS